MKTGRELDRVIAEKVMGLLWGDWIPHYSTSIAAAWEVLEKLTYKKVFLSITPLENTWYEVKDESEGIEFITPEAPLAICLAALKVMRVM